MQPAGSAVNEPSQLDTQVRVAPPAVMEPSILEPPALTAPAKNVAEIAVAKSDVVNFFIVNFPIQLLLLQGHRNLWFSHTPALEAFPKKDRQRQSSIRPRYCMTVGIYTLNYSTNNAVY